MRAAGVRHRVHAGRQREEAGKSGTKGEGQVRKVQALGVPRQEEGPQHTQDIQGSENRLLDYPRLVAADARPRTEGRSNARPKGRRAGLSLQIIRTVRRRLKRSPKKCGFETGSRQMDMVTEMIRKEFGVTVRARTLRRWLRRIGFSWRKDRYVPCRPVSKEGQEEFKGEVGERAAQRRADGMTVFAEDEAAIPEPRLRVEADRGARAGQGKLLKGVCQDIRRDVPRRAANKDRGVDELGDIPGIPGGDPQGPSAVIHGS